MEGVQTESDGDFGNFILSSFGNSSDEYHQHLCTVIGDISQELKQQNIQSTPFAYFTAACSSIGRLTSQADPPHHTVEALFAVLSIAIANSTIGEILSISDQKVISSFFRSTMQKLLQVTQEACKADNTKNFSSMQVDESSKRAQVLDLAVSMLPGLKSEEIIELLYVAIMLTLQDAEGVIQKKAYKLLSMMLRDSNEFISEKFEELLYLMILVLPSCHIAAKHHRLNCLYFLIDHVSKDNQEQRWREVVALFLTEIVLSVKEANKKTRNRAYDILVQIGHAFGDEEIGGNRENLYQIFNMIASGLANETPHMISASAKGLARLAYEFSDLISTAFNLLPSIFLLLQRKNREIIKANLGLLKVLVAKSQAEWLQLHLGSMVEGLMMWQDGTKNRFKAKVKLLLEMLVRKCGMEAVRAVMPEDHMKLLTNIRKIKERKERKEGANSEETRSCLSKATTSRSKIRLKKNLRDQLSDQSDDEPLHLLDQQKTRSAPRPSDHLKRKSSLDDDQVEVDSQGRLIIREEDEQRKVKNADSDHDAGNGADSHLSGKSGTRLQQKRRKTSDCGWDYRGSEYGSKKASGDVKKKKDKLEPYAYWPLDRKMMSRRPKHRAAARKGMASVVKMTKKLQGKSAFSVRRSSIAG